MFAIFCLVLAGHSISAQSISWQALNGPNGVQNIYDLASDASGRLFMYLGGTVYRSADDGNTWNVCSNGLPTYLYFRKFIKSPLGSFYLVPEYGDGVYRYNPASDSWDLIPISVGIWGDYDAFDIDPQGRFWASSGDIDNKVYYSTNEGQTFQQVIPDGSVSGWYEDLATFNDEHNLIAIGEVVFHFNINGTTQQVITNETLTMFVGYNPYTGTAYYADYDGFKRSADGGLNWQDVTLTPNQQFQPYVQKMTFGSDGTIWAHTSGVMYRSEDDGLTWAMDTAFSNLYGHFFHTGAGEWFVSNYCGYPNFGRSTDGGATWTDLSAQFKTPAVFDIKKDAAGTLYALTCRRGAYEKSGDGGQIWSDLVIPDSVPVFASSLATRPDGVMMASGTNGKFYRSFNNGAGWQEMTDPEGDFPPHNSSFFTDYYGAFYFFSGSGMVRKSTDSGDSWQPLNIWGDYYDNFAFHPNGDIFIASDGSYLQVYIADSDTTIWVQFNNQFFYDVQDVHCTRGGMTYVFTATGLYRIVPDGNYLPEPIPFFEGNFNITAIASNAEGDVFVVADQAIYKSEDDGITWENYGTTPASTTGYLSTLFIADDQYMYAGLDGDVIHRSAQPTAESNFIFGKVWLDNDGDCLYDSGEPYQTSVALTATGNGGYTSFSGYNGHFTLSAPSGAYTLNVQPPNALYEACLADVPVTLNGPNDSVFADLPLKAIAQCPYLSVNMTTPILRRCFDVTYTVRYKNEGTAPAAAAYVEITLDSFYIYQSSSLPVASQNDFTYTFNLGDLAPGQTGSFNIVVTVSCEASLGQSHCTVAHIFPDQLCLPTLPPRAFYRECRENIGSFDPNDKRAFVDGKEEPGNVLPNTDIEYLIRFQNTGTDTAFRVVVEDRLSTLLDMASVTPLVASHPYTMEVRDQRVLRFIFDNILLPDSNISETASHGFIKFRVSQMPDVTLGSVIRNQADIFFDFNAPVRTNESNLVVGTVSTRPEPGNPWLVTAYPNPFGASAVFEITGRALPGNATFRLFDALGRELRREEFTGERFVLQRLELEAGLYYFLIESEGRRIGAGKVTAN